MSREEKKKIASNPKDLELAKKIQIAFQNNLRKEVDLEDVLQALADRKKKGITNSFAEIHLGDATYMIRVNGNLWPPYKREHSMC